MAEESDLEKTEPASQRRIDQAREEGDVPRSRELATCMILMTAGVGIWFLGDGLARALSRTLATGLTLEREHAFDPNLLLMRLGSQVWDLLIAFLPLAGLLVLVALASPLLIGGWLFSTKALMPNFGRMNPLSGLGNMVSKRAAVELFKAIAKTIVVGIVAWIVVSQKIDAVLALSVEPLKTGSAHLSDLLLTSFIAIAAALAFIALIDAPYQMWQYANKLKMTREEVRQESKESDGNPEIKAKIRQTQREMARRRMMSEVPTADVVVTNPTHYAVALKYSDGKMRAPTVVAKGADAVAAKIRELAAEHHVPMLESPPLARALYTHADIGDEIPETLYTAVAEVLAYVFQLKAYRAHGGVHPDAPGALDVPPQMDPLNPAAQAAKAAKREGGLQ
ncbi:flagellar biosynthesis protein FlhB [Oxalobacteraceae bacterium R-40]|uniref:Flagellar biosynthetic protein FlhB n=1 Tax=Keguizhuia sedimenti TaxID=3064264 RepID=A0ABU1BPQ0_9BURK|nr:flagellar biosynthesis protein FlhB [Oxalobacteraceae bacterium R-40]